MEHAFYDNEKAEKQPKTYLRKKEDHEFDLLIDIQKKLAQGKGKYYVRFAKNFNTKAGNTIMTMLILLIRMLIANGFHLWKKDYELQKNC